MPDYGFKEGGVDIEEVAENTPALQNLCRSRRWLATSGCGRIGKITGLDWQSR